MTDNSMEIEEYLIDDYLFPSTSTPLIINPPEKKIRKTSTILSLEKILDHMNVFRKPYRDLSIDEREKRARNIACTMIAAVVDTYELKKTNNLESIQEKWNQQ